MRRGLGLALLLGLAGCAGFEAAQPNDSVHTLCYTRLATSAAEVEVLAKQACNGAEPAYRGQQTDLSACPLLVPERLYFSCGG